MFILRSPHRAYDTRYLLICNDDFSQKIGGKIDVHTLNSPGAIGVFNAIFPFWAKMKIVITASCDDFCKNFLSRNQVYKF